MNKTRIFIQQFAAVCLATLLNNPIQAQTSDLWGYVGEKWTPANRLPDFSWAGYKNSDAALPYNAAQSNVKNFGAAGDGNSDDSAAFQRAIDGSSGVILIPAGRYKITKVLKIARSNIVLRGETKEKTVLYFPKNLTQVVGPGETYAPGGSWSWSGGFIQFIGNDRDSKITAVTFTAKRGDAKLTVASTAGLVRGQPYHLKLTNTDGSLGRYLHNNQDSAGADLLNHKMIDFSFKIVSIDGNSITLDRPLRSDVQLAWQPQIYSDLPTVENVGVEYLSIDFPVTPYAGHHVEPGYNAIDFQRIRNGWVKNVAIRNADNGVILREETKNCTITGVRIYTQSGRTAGGFDGHQALLVADLSQDNLFDDFRIEARYIHDLSVTSMAAGNVFSKGYARDMRFDHHRKAPHDNLYTEIDAGVGSDVWYSGGDDDAGPHTAARQTFWNIKATKPQTFPSWAIMMNFIGMYTYDAVLKTTAGNWNEPLYGSIEPVNLFLDQLEHRHNPVRTPPSQIPPVNQPPTGDPHANQPVVTPNPWVATQHSGQSIHVVGLKEGSSIQLKNTRAELIKELNAPNGEAVWNLTTQSGGRASSGTYLYVATLADGTAVSRRIIVIR